MKLKHLFAGMLAFAALACNPVDDQPEVIPALDVPTKAFTVDAAGETVTLTFTTNQDWTVTPSEDWVSVDPAAGAGSAEAINVTVTAADNTVEAERTLIESSVRRENRKKYIDKIAAVIILQGYLDRH